MRLAYIITYDLSKPGRNYEEVLSIIKDYPLWAKLGGSSYIIMTEETPAQIRDKIIRVLDSNDKLFVGRVKAPAAWYNMSDEVSSWLKEHLD